MAKLIWPIKYVEDLEATGKLQRIRVPDNQGLYLQVMPKPNSSGRPVKSWVFRYSKRGLPYWVTLGQFPDVSISKAAALSGQCREWLRTGLDPKVMRSPVPVPVPAPIVDTTPTIKEVAERFYTEWIKVKNKPSTQSYQRWLMDKYVLPDLGDLPFTELTPKRVGVFLASLADVPVTANRARALISKMVNWARIPFEEVAANMINPAQGQTRNEETPRDRRMSEAEIRALGKAYKAAKEPLAHVPIFLLLTGAREGAVLHLKLEYHRADLGLLAYPPKLPGLKGATKVFLCKTATDLLPRLPLPVLHRSLWRSWGPLRSKAKLGEGEGENPLGVSLHDLRRTFASVGADLGYSDEIINALLGHSAGKITGTYIVRGDPVLSEVSEAIGNHISVLLGLVKPVKAKAKDQAAGKAEPTETIKANSPLASNANRKRGEKVPTKANKPK